MCEMCDQELKVPYEIEHPDEKPYCQYCEEHVKKTVEESGYTLCLECAAAYNNKTGFCSLGCCITGCCDESC